MRRGAVLIGAGAALLLAGVTWLAAGQLGVPEGGLPPPTPPIVPGPSLNSVKEKVDVNRAGPEELGRLPGITPQLAERILKNRPYRNLDDLVMRKVLGKKQFARIRELVIVGRSDR
jgi:hypothetical protein